MQIEDGQQFGRWRVLKFAGTNARGYYIYKCICICGKVKELQGDRLKNGKTLSCGCLRSDQLRQKLTGIQWTKKGIKRV